jgi:hypothetical protein
MAGTGSVKIEGARELRRTLKRAGVAATRTEPAWLAAYEAGVAKVLDTIKGA